MFDVDTLISDSQAAILEAEPRLAIRDVLKRALSDTSSVADALRPTEGGITLLHNTEELTVLHAVWAPRMQLFPHNHNMWAVIGIYAGQENNSFYRRAESGLDASGGKELDEGSVLVLGDDVIHAVANPLDRLAGAIHIYGGDFVKKPRSAWGPGPMEERPHDINVLRQYFADANESWRNSQQ